MLINYSCHETDLVEDVLSVILRIIRAQICLVRKDINQSFCKYRSQVIFRVQCPAQPHIYIHVRYHNLRAYRTITGVYGDYCVYY